MCVALVGATLWSVEGTPIVLIVVPVVIGVLLFRYSAVRLATFTFGAFFVFQIEAGLTAPKVAYAAAVTVSAIIASVRLVRLRPDWLLQFKPVLVGSAVLVGWLIVVTLPHSVAGQGIDVTNWTRDALTYLLIPAGVVIGLDAAVDASLRSIRLHVIAIGLLASYGFAAAWVGRRGFGAQALGQSVDVQSVLSSTTAISLGMALSFTLALSGRRVKVHWLALGGVMLVSVLVTGTRTGLVLIATLFGLIGRRATHSVRPATLVVGALGLAALLAVALPFAASTFTSEQFVTQRLQSAIATLTGGFSTDYSGVIRQRASDYSAEIWLAHPLLGQGLGIAFPNPNPGGVATNFSLDTPVAYLAKFGLLGSIVLAVSLVLMVYPLIMGGATRGWFKERTAVRGAAFYWVLLLPFGMTTEDKGFSIVLCLAVCLVASAVRDGLQDEKLLMLDPVIPMTAERPRISMGNTN